MTLEKKNSKVLLPPLSLDSLVVNFWPIAFNRSKEKKTVCVKWVDTLERHLLN